MARLRPLLQHSAARRDSSAGKEFVPSCQLQLRTAVPTTSSNSTTRRAPSGRASVPARTMAAFKRSARGDADLADLSSDDDDEMEESEEESEDEHGEDSGEEGSEDEEDGISGRDRSGGDAKTAQIQGKLKSEQPEENGSMRNRPEKRKRIAESGGSNDVKAEAADDDSDEESGKYGAGAAQ
eukprot:5541793-Pleurochrysis_carterae.AAC.1